MVTFDALVKSVGQLQETYDKLKSEQSCAQWYRADTEGRGKQIATLVELAEHLQSKALEEPTVEKTKLGILVGACFSLLDEIDKSYETVARTSVPVFSFFYNAVATDPKETTLYKMISNALLGKALDAKDKVSPETHYVKGETLKQYNAFIKAHPLPKKEAEPDVDVSATVGLSST